MATETITTLSSPNPAAHYWRGEGPLWRVFWLWGVLGSWILFGLFTLAIREVGLTWPLFSIAAAVMIPYTTWILASVWQCAHNVGNYVWSNVARFLTGVWALNVGVVGGFLLVELLSA